MNRARLPVKSSAWEYFSSAQMHRAHTSIRQSKCITHRPQFRNEWVHQRQKQILLEAAIGVALKVKSYCSGCARWTPTEWFSSAGASSDGGIERRPRADPTPRRAPRQTPPADPPHPAAAVTKPPRPSARNHPQQIKLMNTEIGEINYSKAVPLKYEFSLCLQHSEWLTFAHCLFCVFICTTFMWDMMNTIYSWNNYYIF